MMAKEPFEAGIPVHIGIIMDGNGRWAEQRGLARTQGHLEGLKAAKRITKAASDMGVKYLTLYAFSTENWKRACEEVSFIMGLIKQYLKSEFDFSRRNRIRTRYTGDLRGLPPDIQKELAESMSGTCDFEGMQVILAINYGGRNEILRAFKNFACANDFHRREDFLNVIENMSEQDVSQSLDNPDIPDPDLIIRSAGEYRMSNFLLWQAAYSELYVSHKFWPDWDKQDLVMAIEEYKKRERRYGGIIESGAASKV